MPVRGGCGARRPLEDAGDQIFAEPDAGSDLHRAAEAAIEETAEHSATASAIPWRWCRRPGGRLKLLGERLDRVRDVLKLGLELLIVLIDR